jgi:hypothetical protein
LALVWAVAVVWGWASGTIRQVGILVGVYVAAGIASVFYGFLGRMLAAGNPFVSGEGNNVLAWGFIFLFVLAIVVVGLFRTYPKTGLGRNRLPDHFGGGVVAAVWGIMLLITILTLLRYYTVVVWPGQRDQQQAMAAEIKQSSAAHVLADGTPQLWLLMSPWFPPGVTYALP